MNQSQGSGSVLKRKKNDYDYSSSEKIIKLDENEESEEESKNEAVEKKPIKKGSSSQKAFGMNYMLKHGYKEGFGLGKYENGIVEPVEASKQRGRRGFGFEPTDLKDAVAKYDPDMEEVFMDEEVTWLVNEYPDTLDRETLESWVKVGPAIPCLDENSKFCDSNVVRNIFDSKNVLDSINSKDFENGRRRSNPFESIQNGIFLNRAAMKMANMDAILDRMFTKPTDESGKEVVGRNRLLYFADVCAGPGGFSEYVLYRKKWRAKGFGFTLRNENDFALDQFGAGPPESFEPFYGVNDDGDVYSPENILSLKNHVLKYTNSEGVHFMMADGGVEIEQNLNDQELICKKLYLCQCLVALHIVRTNGHFVVKLFDLFTEFSVGLLYLMYRSFKQVLLLKPNTSRPANSERYFVCKWKREDCSDIADFLFDINKRVPLYEEKSDKDILELVPTEVLLNDEKFYNYVLNSNNSLGNRQIVNLRKLAAFSENTNLKDDRQQELRKASLKKWNIPDEARADPKKCDARTKWNELLGQSSLSEFDAKKNRIQSVESLKKKILSKHSWYGVIVSKEEMNTTCGLYLGLGRNNVQKYECGKWVKPISANLCLPTNTLVFGEVVYEYLGMGRAQTKIFAFHIIDGMYLGGEDIRNYPFTQRLKMCRLFAESLHKESFPIRVKHHYPMTEMNALWDSLVLRPLKSSNNKCLCVPLDSGGFYTAGGVIFIRDTKDPWNRHFSKTQRAMYLYNREKSKNVYENDLKNSFHEIYGDFEYCFQTKLFWWWNDGVVVHESQSFNPDPSKMQRKDLMMWIESQP